MLDDNVPKTWHGQTTLVFALSAVAVGLGNLFRLPYLLGEHGGAPFFIAYLATLLTVTAPVLAAEVMLGSAGRGTPVGAIRWTSDQSGRSVYWSWLGAFQALLALLLAGQLLAVVGWAFDRAWVMHSGTLAAASAHDVADSFSWLISDIAVQLPLVGGVLIIAVVLAALGPQYAMAIIGWLALPSMAVALLGVLDFTLDQGDLVAAHEFLFAADYSRFDVPAAMAGVTSGLYTLGAGLGIGLCFGTRAPKGLPILRAVVATVIIDTSFALVTAIIVMPLLFAANVAPTEGLSLVFIAIPYAFSNLPLGDTYGALFFGFVGLAGVAALVALMEPAVMLLRRDWEVRRWIAAPIVAAAVLLLSIATQWLNTSLSDVLDTALLVSFLLVAVFVGWRVPRPIVRGELYREPRWLFALWWSLLRLMVPAVLLVAIYWHWTSPAVAS